nr:MAG TPA: helix-turn-helix domain protein [Bacteriophage sp.]
MIETIPAVKAYGLLAVLHKAGMTNKEIADKTGLRLSYIEQIPVKAKTDANISREFYQKMVDVFEELQRIDPAVVQKIKASIAEGLEDSTDHDMDDAAPEGATPQPEHSEAEEPAPKVKVEIGAVGLTTLEAIVLQQAVEDWTDQLNRKLRRMIINMVEGNRHA